MIHPLAQIPGCGSANKIDNRRTPRSTGSPDEGGSPLGKTVRIPLSSLATCEAVAELYSYIAFPLEAKERKEFSIAMARWAVFERGLEEKSWNERADMKPSIRPIVFSQPESLWLKIYTRGATILYRRLVLALMMLKPQLLDEMSMFSPTVSNVVTAAAAKLGYSDGSQKTIEARVWAPLKPVVHMAAAAMELMGTFDWCRQLWNEERYPLCYRQPLLATLFYDDIVREYLLPVAELYRLQLPSCERFEIREENTIRFVAD